MNITITRNYFNNSAAFSQSNNWNSSTWSALLQLQRSDNNIEVCFGWFFLIVGCISAIANSLILIALAKFLRCRNVLYMIIANFAVIDLFKSMNAMYMGSVIVSVFLQSEVPTLTGRYFVIMKMLQSSVLMFNIGNIASVFNLVLASLNEFLFMRLPFRYKKLITKQKVGFAIGLTWALSIVFSFAKAFHNGYAQGTSNVWVGPANASGYSSSSAETLNETVFSQSKCMVAMDSMVNISWEAPKALKCLGSRGQTTSTVMKLRNYDSGDAYTVVLMSGLMLCLAIVMTTYISLYILIRRSANFSHYQEHLPPQESFASNHSSHEETRLAERKISRRKTSLYAPAQQFLFGSSSKSCVSRQWSRQHRFCFYCCCCCCCSKQTRKADLDRTRSNDSQTNYVHRRLLKRHKAVMVIMTVCGLYTVYLSVYFTLQLMHMQHVNKGVTQHQLNPRYIINFTLRALYFVQAALNPFLFFRIRSFRLSVVKLLKSCTMCCRRRSRSRSEVSGATSQPHVTLSEQENHNRRYSTLGGRCSTTNFATSADLGHSVPFDRDQTPL